jgi:hypothetical protein
MVQGKKIFYRNEILSDCDLREPYQSVYDHEILDNDGQDLKTTWPDF